MANFEIIPITDDYYGIKRIESAVDTLICFIMPREMVGNFKGEEAEKPGIYFLYDNSQRKIYIGQSGASSKNRLTDHKKEDWWTDALVFTTKTDDISPTHAKILESRFIERAKDLGLDYENKQPSKEPLVKDKYGEDCVSWEKQIVSITKLLNMKLFVRQENKEDGKQRTSTRKETFKYPSKYKIYGKTYDWTYANEMIINQCERILEIQGSNAIYDAINTIDKKGIKFNKENSSDVEYMLSDKRTSINIHGSAIDIYRKTEAIAKLFPEFKLELIYD